MSEEQHSNWYEIVEFPDKITMIAEPGHYEDVKSYLVEGDRDVAVLDTGMGVGGFTDLVKWLSDRDPIVLQSHAHFDHIGASSEFERVLVHPSEAGDLRTGYPHEKFAKWFEPQYMGNRPLPEAFDIATCAIPGKEPSGALEAGQVIDLGGRQLEVFHTPGHSPGGITLLDRAAKALFPGDAVYLGPMFAYADTSDPEAYRETLALLAQLADEVDHVYPSHNAVPMSPDDLREMHAAYEEIFAGREPDKVDEARTIYDFGRFSFHLPGRTS